MFQKHIHSQQGSASPRLLLSDTNSNRNIGVTTSNTKPKSKCDTQETVKRPEVALWRVYSFLYRDCHTIYARPRSTTPQGADQGYLHHIVALLNQKRGGRG